MKTELNNRIRRLRFDFGEITQEELANLVGVTRQTIIALEANRYVPSLLLAYRIAQVFHVRIEEVFQMVPPEENSPEQTETRLPPAGK
jgi:putative transcriptional regulator